MDNSFQESIVIFLQFTPPELLLFSLIFVFIAFGFLYKLWVKKQCAKIRRASAQDKRKLGEHEDLKKAAKNEIKELIKLQKKNAQIINTIKHKKEKMTRLPTALKQGLSDLTSWCDRRKITVNFKCRQASRVPAPPGRRL